MKRTIFTTLILIGAFVLKAQHSLQFDQTLLVTTTQTVQANHTWKVVGVYYTSTIPDPICSSSTGCFTPTTLTDMINIGGTNTVVRLFKTTGNANMGASNVLWEQEYPLWLPSGTTLAAGSGVKAVSVIDFVIN